MVDSWIRRSRSEESLESVGSEWTSGRRGVASYVSPRIKSRRPRPPITGGVRTVPSGSRTGSREVCSFDRRVRGLKMPCEERSEGAFRLRWGM